MQILNIVLLVLSVILVILGLFVSKGMNKILISVMKGYKYYMNLRAYYLTLSFSTIVFLILLYLKADEIISVLIYFFCFQITNIIGSYKKMQDISAESTELLKIRRMQSLESLYIIIPVWLIIVIFQNHWVAFFLLLVGALILSFKDLVFINEYESEYSNIKYRFFYTALLLHFFMLSAVFNLATNSEYYKIVKLIQFGCALYMQANTLLTMIFTRKRKFKTANFDNNSNIILQ